MNGMARGDRFRVEHSTRVLRSATRRKHRRGAAQWADPLAQMPRTPAFAAGASKCRSPKATATLRRPTPFVNSVSSVRGCRVRSGVVEFY